MKGNQECRSNPAWSRCFLFRLGAREKAIASVSIFTLWVMTILIFGNQISMEAVHVDLSKMNQPPSLQHLFGTDWVGRDMLMRTLKGLSMSIKVGIICSLSSSLVAVVLGVIGPLFGGKIDAGVSWLVDLVLSVPHAIVIILISIACGGGFKGLVIGVAVTHWTSLTRVIRAEVMQIKASEYVQASRQFGKSKLYISVHHLVPHIVPQLVVGTVLVFPHAILHEASITFLGFGLPPHEPAIGVILSESMKYLTSGQWWLAVFPGLALILVSMAVASVGKNVEKILNPATAYKQ